MQAGTLYHSPTQVETVVPISIKIGRGQIHALSPFRRQSQGWAAPWGPEGTGPGSRKKGAIDKATNGRGGKESSSPRTRPRPEPARNQRSPGPQDTFLSPLHGQKDGNQVMARDLPTVRTRELSLQPTAFCCLFPSWGHWKRRERSTLGPCTEGGGSRLPRCGAGVPGRGPLRTAKA